MPCPKYDSLKQEHKIAFGNVNLFRPENRSVHGYPDRKASQMRQAAQRRAFELATEMSIHAAACDVCKREYATSDQTVLARPL